MEEKRKGLSLSLQILSFTIFISFFSLIICSAYNLWQNFEQAKTLRLHGVTSLLNITALNASAPVAFKDKEAIQLTLDALKLEQSIQYARIIYKDLSLAADLMPESTEKKTSNLVSHETITLEKDIVIDDESLGKLILIVSFDDLFMAFWKSTKRTFIILLACLVTATFLAYLFLPFITKPILYLLKTITQITEDKNYSIRLEPHGSFETRKLISQFNQMLAEIDKRDSDLEKQVEERTKSLNKRTEDLKKAIVKAKEANRAKSQFLANMSHEMRTPLTGIIGLIEALQELNNDEESRDLTNLLSTSADSLLAVINDVLDFSKIEEGKINIEMKNFKHEDCMGPILNLSRFQAEDKSILFIEDIRIPKNMLCKGDSQRLQQVLLNLLMNAIKFTSVGGVIVVQSWIEEFEHGLARLYFSVSDTGIGIALEKQPAVFEAFVQADGTISRDYGGTGIGLAICRNLVNLMGGKIGVSSVPEVGSCFSFYIAHELVIEEDFTIGSQDFDSKMERDKSPRNILVVEDSQLNQRLIKSILEKENHTVTIADNGKIAVQKVHEGEFDIIFMDIQMPEMDGLEATKHIRSMPNGKSYIPIIGLSAHAFRDQKESSLESGMDSYLTKPFRKSELLAEIERVLNKSVNKI